MKTIEVSSANMRDEVTLPLYISNASNTVFRKRKKRKDVGFVTYKIIVTLFDLKFVRLFPLLQVANDLYKMHLQSLSGDTVNVLIKLFSSIASHAHELNCNKALQLQLQRVCSILEITEPPVVHFETETYQIYVNFLYDLHVRSSPLYEEKKVEQHLVSLCEEVLMMYLECAGESPNKKSENKSVLHWAVPLGSAKKEELAARTPLVLSVLRVLNGLEQDSFRRHSHQLLPLLVNFIRSEHSSMEVQQVLSTIFQSCVGPLITNC